MAIGPSVATWLASLNNRGVFENMSSVVELGPSEFFWPKKTVAAFLEQHFPNEQARSQFLSMTTEKSDCSYLAVSNAFYELLGIKEYNSIDFGNSKATIKHNLNLPFEPEQTFDIVGDFGTLEHVFNIGEAFRTVHNLLRSGGVALHQLPTFGGYFHGFYNISSVTFRSLIEANHYEVLDLLYIHDQQLEDTRIGRGKPFNFEDISDVEVRRQTVKFLAHHFGSILFRRERTSSQIFAALRKTSDAPFEFPHQINKYAINPETELWQNHRPHTRS
jgi:SAM-dependent methyltransferase